MGSSRPRVADLFLVAFALFLKAGEFGNELSLESVSFLIGSFGHLIFEEDFFLSDLRVDRAVDLGDLLLLLEGELHGGGGFFETAHGEFVCGFHGGVVTNPTFRTQKNCGRAPGSV